MIKTWGELRAYVRDDARARNLAPSFMTFLRDPIFRFNCYLRMTEFLVNSGAPAPARVLSKLLLSRLSIRLGFSVPLNVFGPGLAIVHYGLLVVSPFARVGRDCRVHAGVNIGGTAGFFSQEEARDLAPKIGDRCYIGPGAKIFGRSRVGNDCAIGANSVVNNFVAADGVTIAGMPARVISGKGSFGMIIEGSLAPSDPQWPQGGDQCVG